MMKPGSKLVAALIMAAGLAGPALGATGVKHPHAPEGGWSFSGPLGTFDTAQLQRGFKVYREVCAACHSMELLHFRNLGEEGGPFFDPDFPNPNDNPVVRLIASEYAVPTIDSETGDEIERPALPSDRFVSPFPNDAAARGSNGGALPPDLSVITKARHDGANYVYSLLSGYPGENSMKMQYAKLEVAAGQYYNPYFPGDTSANWQDDPRHPPPGGMLAMAPPLDDDLVDYDDGTEATLEQAAADVTAFLVWAAEPKQIERKKVGLSVIIYLLVLTVLVYASYRRIWRDQH